MNVVLFTGGRGSEVLSKELLRNRRVAVTLAINGYDDGLSTGEVRRFLGNSLGPSDFRKNVSRLASVLKTCSNDLVALLDLRFPEAYSHTQALAVFRLLQDAAAEATDEFQVHVKAKAAALDPQIRDAVGSALRLVERELDRTRFPFSFGDCSLGNLVFAGVFLSENRDFNRTVDGYCALHALPPGMIENVTDGQNACLVAVDREGRLLHTEAEIVSADRPHYIRDIYLLNRPITDAERLALQAAPPGALQQCLAESSIAPAANPRLLRRIAEADLIVYAPGTQHSSLFPSYVTPGVGAAIARNFRAIKVLITNLQKDAEISGNSAVDLINKAQYYLREKNRLNIPTPCLITHYLLNEPGHSDAPFSYVPLGSLDRLDDPRLVRIGNYEDGVSGRHDAKKVLTPFVKAFLRRDERLRLAVLLVNAASLNKICQTIVEMTRAGLEQQPVIVTVYYESSESFDAAFVESLPFEVSNLSSQGPTAEAAFDRIANDPAFDYVVMFESSGMYKGDNIVGIVSHLHGGRLDAVWGSRRLSINDINNAYRLVYRHKFRGAVSYVGSHLLSLACLFVYGRHISDTLSGVWAVRARFLHGESVDYHRRDFNQVVLSRLLRRRAELLEIPVYYFPISPKKIRRTTIRDGLRSLGAIVFGRFRRTKPVPQVPDRPIEDDSDSGRPNVTLLRDAPVRSPHL